MRLEPSAQSRVTFLSEDLSSWQHVHLRFTLLASQEYLWAGLLSTQCCLAAAPAH